MLNPLQAIDKKLVITIDVIIMCCLKRKLLGKTSLSFNHTVIYQLYDQEYILDFSFPVSKIHLMIMTLSEMKGFAPNLFSCVPDPLPVLN